MDRRSLDRGTRLNTQPKGTVYEQNFHSPVSAVRFGAVGIGSREYDTFCGAIDKLEAALKANGAKQIGETLKINVLEHEIPEDPAEVWVGSWKDLL